MPVSAAGEKFLRASSRIKRTIYIPVKRIHRDSSKLSRVAAGLRCVPAWITLEGEIMKFTENARWDGGSGSRWRVTRRRFWMTVAVLVASAATTALAARGRFDGRDDDRDEDHDRGRYAIGLWGDLPYSDVQAQTGVPNLIADMNSQDLAFTAHDGDLKAGNGISGSTTPTTCA